MRPALPALTAARFVAAVFVVIFHYDKKAAIFPAPLIDFGYQPVTFFFILSGFILTYTHGQESGRLNVNVRTFLKLRAAKLFPHYTLALIIAAPFGLKLVPAIALVPLMLQSWWPPASILWNPPAWSLSNEAFFYVLFPFAWWVLSRSTGWIGACVITALIVAASLLKHAIIEDHHALAAYYPVLNLPQFLLGIVIAKVYFVLGAPRSAIVPIVSVSMLICVILLKPIYPLAADSIVLSIVFSFVVYSLATTWRMHPWLIKLGNASYALYILHVPVWFWWDNIVRVRLGLDLTPSLDFSLYALLTLTASLVATEAVKIPFLARGFPHLMHGDV